ncbi:hypothetical protein Tco_0193238, partial [Tanacetum coccineum]
KSENKAVPDHDYILLPLMTSQGLKDAENEERAVEINTNITNSVTAASSSVNAAQPKNVTSLPNDPLMPDLEDIGIFKDAYDDQDVGAEADFNNLDSTMIVSPIPTTRIHKDHPLTQIIGDLQSVP